MNVQEVCKALGESGCYFISLLKVVGREDDAIRLFRQALGQGLIDEDCYVRNPSGLLSLAVGGAWTVRHESASYVPKGDEKEILRFERKVPLKTFAHFVVGDGSGKVAYDPLGKSMTVQSGTLQSKRIVKRGIA